MQFFEKRLEDVQKHTHGKLVTTEKRIKYLVSEPNYQTSKFFIETLLTTEMKKSQIHINQPVCLSLSILKLSKTKKYECLCDHVKPKYGEKARLYQMDTNSFIAYIKTNDIYKYIGEDVETMFVTSSYELHRPLSKSKRRKVIVLMKDEPGGKTMKEFVGFKAKTHSYLIDYGSEDKLAKGQIKVCHNKKTKVSRFQKLFIETPFENKINDLEKNKVDVDSLKKSES